MSKHCDICSVDLQDEYAYQGHLSGKRHLKNLKQAELKRKITECSIFVSPLPKFISQQDLIAFFLQFGTISKYRFGSNHVIIEFDNRGPVDFLLSKPIRIHHAKLSIKRRVINNNSTKKPKGGDKNTTVEDKDPISYDNIKSIFEKETTFDSQLISFLNTVQLSDVEVETRYGSVTTHLNSIFRSVFPKCETHRFGSTQTGLGFKECDLDIYMDIGEPVFEDKNAVPNSWVMQRIFKEVKKVMYRMNTVFSDIVPIPKAKTPIIKFRHVPTNVSCDISFKNALGVYNSYLIKHCLSLDVRLKPLMIIIKYWARHFGISGSGRISNYGLIMLIIFYLQQPSVNILPAIKDLQSTCVPQIVNGWQVNFDKNAVLPAITNNSSIPQLLHGFFTFYAKFEFKARVICPLDGIARAESDFKQPKNLPECMARYKGYLQLDENFWKLDVGKPMCVQDPIELNHNVTASTPPRILETFQVGCQLGAEICASTSKTEYKDLLKTLITVAPKIEKRNYKDYKIVITSGRFLKVGLPEDFETRTDIVDKEQFIKDNWYFTVFNIIKDIFEKVFKVQVQLLTADKEAKQQKIEMLSDVHTKDHQTIILRCSGGDCVWRNRKSNQLILDPSLSWLDKEALLSDKVVEDSTKKGGSSKVKLDFTCTLEKNSNPVQVLLTLTDENSGKQMFREFAEFARGKLPKIVDKTMMHMQQFKKRY